MKNPIGISSYAIKFEGFLDPASNSLKPDQVNQRIMLLSLGRGYSTLFDVASNQKLLDLMATIYARGGERNACLAREKQKT